MLAALSAVATLSSVFPILQAMPHHEHPSAREIQSTLEKEREATVARHREHRRSETPSPRKRPGKRKRQESEERHENSPLRFDTAIQTTPSPKRTPKKALADSTNSQQSIFSNPLRLNNHAIDPNRFPSSPAVRDSCHPSMTYGYPDFAQVKGPEISTQRIHRRTSISNVTDYDSPPERPGFHEIADAQMKTDISTSSSAGELNAFPRIHDDEPIEKLNRYPLVPKQAAVTMPSSLDTSTSASQPTPSSRSSSSMPSSETITPADVPERKANRSMFTQLNVPFSDEADIVFNPEDFLDDLSTQDEMYSDD